MGSWRGSWEEIIAQAEGRLRWMGMDGCNYVAGYPRNEIYGYLYALSWFCSIGMKLEDTLTHL
jgi:hypothetical protein